MHAGPPWYTGSTRGAELLGEHLVPVLSEPWSRHRGGYGAQREVLLEKVGAIAGDVVIVGGFRDEVAGAPQPKAAKHHAAPNMCRFFMPCDGPHVANIEPPWRVFLPWDVKPPSN